MMNMKPRVLAGALLAAVLSGPTATIVQTAQQTPQQTPLQDKPAPHRSLDTAASPERRFVDEAAIDRIQEAALARLAVQKGASEPIRRLGQRMLDENGPASEMLQAIAQVKGYALPTSLDARREKEIERLQKLNGPEFDRAYMKLVLEDHHNDIREFRKQAQHGTDADIRSFAATTLPKLHDHLAIAREAARTANIVDQGRKPSATANTSPSRDRTTGAEDSAPARTQSR